MTQIPSTERELERLNQHIEKLQSTATQLRRKRSPLEAAARAASFCLGRLRLKRWVRSPAQTYQLWKIGCILIGSAIAATVSFLAFLGGSGLAVVVSCAIAALIAAGSLYRLMYCPSDSRLTELLVEADIAAHETHTRLRNLRASDGLSELTQQIRSLHDEKRQLLETIRREIESGIVHRAALLRRDWKAMRDNEWENYLVEVFNALGAKAERIGCSGDQGCDLIVESGTRRIAVQAKGYENSVGNGAVQEVFAGMHHHRCTMCAVITNSRFTRGAQELAESTNCILIGEDQIPNFVIGQTDFLHLSKNPAAG